MNDFDKTREAKMSNDLPKEKQQFNGPLSSYDPKLFPAVAKALVASANKIIGESLRNNEADLRYLWITDMTNDKAPSVIYVPTEANISILEAGRSSNR